jgi:hypothetical protein
MGNTGIFPFPHPFAKVSELCNTSHTYQSEEEHDITRRGSGRPAGQIGALTHHLMNFDDQNR